MPKAELNKKETRTKEATESGAATVPGEGEARVWARLIFSLQHRLLVLSSIHIAFEVRCTNFSGRATVVAGS